ncbi:MAG: alpha-galactosidase [Opitutaceae bacterium]|nr:alpha-galactosidase [Opitutaceae bacterium]
MTYSRITAAFTLLQLMLWIACPAPADAAAGRAAGSAPPAFASWDENRLVLDNGVVRRVVTLKPDGISCAQLTLAGFPGSSMVARDKGAEFRFDLKGGGTFSGASRWERPRCEAASDTHGGRGAAIVLEAPGSLRVKVVYLLYPDLPVVRKQLVIENTGSADVAVENVDVERLQLVDDDVHCQVYVDYARRAHLGPYLGDWHDALTMLLFSTGKFDARAATWGLAVGNEASGVLKRVSAFLGDKNELAVGVRRADEPYAFRRWLRPGERWASERTFIVPYANEFPTAVLNGPVNDFVRRHLGLRLAELSRKPTFVYNTWQPFMVDIDERLVMDLAKQASEMGFEEFVIDDGWQANRTDKPGPRPIGDWLVDRKRFPRGLKPVFDYVKSLGMKPGLWLSLGAVSTDSAVYAEHPEWLARGPDQKPIYLHNTSSKTRVTACLATGWTEHFKQMLLGLVRDNGLEYIKLDLAVIASAYVNDPWISGCCATDHPGHRDHAESHGAIYAALWRMFDELHAAVPQLFIDCTYEAIGKLNLVDYALCEHAEGDWLSNFDNPAVLDNWRVRQMAWWRSPAMPATALVIGNQRLDDPNWELSFKSLVGAFPIFLGDLRAVPPERKQRVRQWADWLKRMQAKYDYAMYRSDLPGFGEPAAGAWDGFSRINTDTRAGGLVGVFRDNALENSRRVFVPGLEQDNVYVISVAPEGRVLHEMTGRQLAETGFEVKLESPQDGTIFGIERR